VTSEVMLKVMAEAQHLGISFRLEDGRVWVKLPRNRNPSIDALVTKIRANRDAFAAVLRHRLDGKAHAFHPDRRLKAAMPQAGAEAALPLKMAEPATQERMKASQRQFGQIHASLFPLVGRRIWTPQGAGKLLSVFHDRCDVLLDSAGRRIRVRPADVRLIQ
jgi:hypothetical protein